MELIDIDVKTFKKELYKDYKKMFPRLERKSYNHLKKCNNLRMCNFIKIIDNGNIIGFMIVNTIRDIKYAQLDYFAILPQYQDNGYGTRSLELLKNKYQELDGIFVEAETLGLGRNETENNQRVRRDKFYRKAGFIPLNYEFDLYRVIYTPYILFTNNKQESEEEIVNKMFTLYYKTIGVNGTDKFNRNCKYRCLN